MTRRDRDAARAERNRLQRSAILAEIAPPVPDEDRIRELAAHGLKVRDISAALGLHPLIVQRVLEAG